jgi:hypothetical protein
VLPRPFYLNEILVTPNLVQNLLSIRRFTTDNSRPMEFDMFGLSVKDLVTQSMIARYDSSAPSTPFNYLLLLPLLQLPSHMP